MRPGRWSNARWMRWRHRVRPGGRGVVAEGLLWAGLALLLVLAYRAAAAALYRPGFPLDDAWIHQTYARHVAAGVGWVYRVPDLGRGAVTAPLWVLLLAVGHVLGLEPGLWVTFLGWLTLTGLAVVAARWPGLEGPWRWVAGLAVLGQWHLVWAAVSGMETAAFALAVLVALWALAQPRPRWDLAGAAVGVALWLRPEGALVLALFPLGLMRIANSTSNHQLPTFLRGIGWSLLAAALYLGLHRWWTGAWWPTTGPAKIHEYAALRAAPLLLRWLRVWQPVLVGPGLLAVVGILLWATRQFVGRWFPLMRIAISTSTLHLPPSSLHPLPWLLLHSLLYAWRLPVTYQHGRYLMPILPALAIAGVGAWQALGRDWHRRAWLALAGVAAGLTLGFWALGARAYAWDVAFIESEMVDTAHWVARNLPPDAVIAAHDIGALGYFAPQPLVDLAGLLDPAVIPIVRNEKALARYMQRQGVAYLVTFPGWYAELDRCSRPLFTTRAPYAPALGGENMVVYVWQPCP